MKVEKRKVKDLQFDPKNARKHSETNIKAIAASLKEFGQQKPIVITEGNMVIAGNGTLEAAKNLGWADIQVSTVPNDWDEETLKAFALADNRTAELAQWDASELVTQLESLVDFDMSRFGFEDFEAPEYEPNTSTGEEPSRGLGTPIISFEIVFDNNEQQEQWFKFLKAARILYPDAETNAERITEAIKDLLPE